MGGRNGVFRVRTPDFSLKYREIRPSAVVGTRREAALRGEGFAWVPDASYVLVCLILFPSVGITVFQHCNTVGIHRSFPQGVV